MTTITKTVRASNISKRDISELSCWVLVSFLPLFTLLMAIFEMLRRLLIRPNMDVVSQIEMGEQLAFYLTLSFMVLCLLTVFGALIPLFIAFHRAAVIHNSNDDN